MMSNAAAPRKKITVLMEKKRAPVVQGAARKPGSQKASTSRKSAERVAVARKAARATSNARIAAAEKAAPVRKKAGAKTVKPMSQPAIQPTAPSKQVPKPPIAAAAPQAALASIPKPATPPQPATITRFPAMEAPDEVPVGQSFSVQV
tara:strand:- start:269 stop:712 length:444 start_codon:yes stop_codon:yes gene_type:complete